MSEPRKQPYLLDIAPLLAMLWESHEKGSMRLSHSSPVVQ
jgi:hypothetical protein